MKSVLHGNDPSMAAQDPSHIVGGDSVADALVSQVAVVGDRLIFLVGKPMSFVVWFLNGVKGRDA